VWSWSTIGEGDTEGQERKDAEYMLIKFIEKMEGKEGE
jgi:hypothetical protein